MTTAEILLRLEHVKKTADGWMARCPGHPDKTPSLCIKAGDGGRTLFHCQAGCQTETVCTALGIKLADLFAEKPNRNGAGKQIVATYPYHDADGKLLFEVVRLDPKDFRQRRPDGKGGWIWDMKGIDRVPFRLPELIKAVKGGKPIYIAEGEKDCDALVKNGFVATCNIGGAGKWRPNYTPIFKDADVIIIRDKDDPGRKHAAAVAGKLIGTARSVKVIECPDLDGKAVKDAADFFAAGGEPADLDALAEAAPLFTAAPVEENPWLSLVEDGADIAAKELPPLVQIVEGIVCEQSKLVICSGAKAFKTWLTITMALCIAHGIPFLGRPTTRRRILYCNLELKPSTFHRRVQAIAKALEITVDKSWFHHLPLRGRMAGLTLPKIVDRIINVSAHVQAGVIVVDPLFKLNIAGEENSTRDQTLFFLELDRLTTEAKCTAILNDHSGKGNQSDKDPLDVIRGASAKAGDLDAAMVLRNHEVKQCFRVDMVHRELPPVDPFVLEWVFPMMTLRPDLNPDAMKKAKGGQARKHDPLKLLAVIKDTTADNAISVSAWAERAGISRQTLQSYLPQLRSKGLISTAGEGNTARKFITNSGREAVSNWEGTA